MSDLVETLARLFDLGGVVVVTAMLYLVWRRLSELTDKFIDILYELRLQNLGARAAENNASQANVKGP